MTSLPPFQELMRSVVVRPPKMPDRLKLKCSSAKLKNLASDTSGERDKEDKELGKQGSNQKKKKKKKKKRGHKGKI